MTGLCWNTLDHVTGIGHISSWIPELYKVNSNMF